MFVILLSLVGLAYIVLAVISFPHVKEGNAISAAGPWWCINKEKYEKDAHGYCVLGRILLFIDLILVAAYIFLPSTYTMVAP